MLIKDYDIEEVTNQNDIEECLRDISKKWRDETIHRLHFHFSGHGIMDQTFVKAFNTNQDFMEINTPIWDHIVGNNGDQNLFSVHFIKYLLNKMNPEMLTITLDCYHDFVLRRPIVKPKLELPVLPTNLESDLRNMLTLHSTCGSSISYDADSFCKELWKVYQENQHHIPLMKLSTLINDSWNNRRVNQVCTMETLEVQNDLKGKCWPA